MGSFAPFGRAVDVIGSGVLPGSRFFRYVVRRAAGSFGTIGPQFDLVTTASWYFDEPPRGWASVHGCGASRPPTASSRSGQRAGGQRVDGGPVRPTMRAGSRDQPVAVTVVAPPARGRRVSAPAGRRRPGVRGRSHRGRQRRREQTAPAGGITCVRTLHLSTSTQGSSTRHLPGARARRRAGAVAAVAVAGLILAACGGTGYGSATSTTSPPSGAGPRGASFHMAAVAGLGSVVVDARGYTVYVLSSGSTKNLPCTSASGCTAVWPALQLPHGVASATAGAGIQRHLLGSVAVGGATYSEYRGVRCRVAAEISSRNTSSSS